jgi:nicotinamide riboside kinase
MKIAISGSHGVGKTTLAKALCAKLNYPMITEVARTVAKEMGFANTDQIRKADKDTITKFQRKIYVNQLLAESSYLKLPHENFISDRSVFDIIAYMVLYGLDDEIINIFTESAAKFSNHYDLIIYCPIPVGTIANDGFRLTDKETQIQYSLILKDLLITRASCPVAYLHPAREQWFESVLKLKIMQGEPA